MGEAITTSPSNTNGGDIGPKNLSKLKKAARIAKEAAAKAAKAVETAKGVQASVSNPYKKKKPKFSTKTSYGNG